MTDADRGAICDGMIARTRSGWQRGAAKLL